MKLPSAKRSSDPVVPAVSKEEPGPAPAGEAKPEPAAKPASDFAVRGHREAPKGDTADASATAMAQTTGSRSLGFETVGQLSAADIRGIVGRMDEPTFNALYRELQYALHLESAVVEHANKSGLISASDYDKSTTDSEARTASEHSANFEALKGSELGGIIYDELSKRDGHSVARGTLGWRKLMYPDLGDVATAIEAKARSYERGRAPGVSGSVGADGVLTRLGIKGIFAGAGDLNAAFQKAFVAPARPQTPAAEGSRPTPRFAASFESRPQTQDKPDGTYDSTWEQMTASLGEAFDMRMAGRVLDTNLVRELSSSERDPMPERVAAAELAAMGAIDSEAFQQITTNINYEGSDRSLEDRLAFAVLLQQAPGAFNRYPMNSGKPIFQVLGQILDKPFAGDWLATARAQAKELLAASMGGTLLSNPTYAETLRGQLERSGVKIPPALASSPPALLVLDAAAKMGARPEQAAALAGEAMNKQLDAVAFRTITALSSWGDKIEFAEQSGTRAFAQVPTVDQAADVARRVAKGELGLGQLHGFMIRFGSDLENPPPPFDLGFAAGVISLVNQGAVKEASLAKVLDVKTYFPGNLGDRVWAHFFRDSNRPERAVYAAPLMQNMTPDLVRTLANDEKKLAAFTQAFEAKVSEALPHDGVARVVDRLVGTSGQEHAQYQQLIASAVAAARAAAVAAP